MRLKISILALLLLSAVASQAQSLLQAGPMLGYAEMFEVGLWVQTTKPATVQVRYYDVAEKPRVIYNTAAVPTQSQLSHTAKLVADQVKPGHRYAYDLYINNKKVNIAGVDTLRFRTQELWQSRRPAPDFTFMLGSCLYVCDPPYDRPGKCYGSDFEILTPMAQAQADFMLWLGDNVYLRDPDWGTRTGYLYRYNQMRQLPALQPLLRACPQYAIWDDHDFGPNDADGSWHQKRLAEEVFNAYWMNPSTNVIGQGGITGQFSYNDCEFFLLDNRYHRASNQSKEANRPYFGQAQIAWLLNALETSKAPFKFVVTGGQVLNPYDGFTDQYATFKEERAQLLAELQKRQLGVIFLTGDRHHSELSLLPGATEGAPAIYDFTCSSITSGTHADPKEVNSLQVPGSLIAQHNYGLINVSGDKANRALRLRAMDKTGKEIWSRDIKASELKVPKK
jgi:alkaline phosphatase D